MRIPSYLVERGPPLFCVVKNIQTIQSVMYIFMIETGFHYNHFHVSKPKVVIIILYVGALSTDEPPVKPVTLR